MPPLSPLAWASANTTSALEPPCWCQSMRYAENGSKAAFYLSVSLVQAHPAIGKPSHMAIGVNE